MWFIVIPFRIYDLHNLSESTNFKHFQLNLSNSWLIFQIKFANITILFSLFEHLQDLRGMLWSYFPNISKFKSQLFFHRIASKSVYRFYIPMAIDCLNFIEIKLVLLAYWQFKVLKSNNIYANKTLYRPMSLVWYKRNVTLLSSNH